MIARIKRFFSLPAIAEALRPPPSAGQNFACAMELAERLATVRRRVVHALEAVDSPSQTDTAEIADELLYLQDDMRALAVNILSQQDPLDFLSPFRY
jgi:hypothetical protein